MFGLEITLVQSNQFVSCQLPDFFVKNAKLFTLYLCSRKIRIRYGLWPPYYEVSIVNRKLDKVRNIYNSVD